MKRTNEQTKKGFSSAKCAYILPKLGELWPTNGELHDTWLVVRRTAIRFQLPRVAECLV